MRKIEDEFSHIKSTNKRWKLRHPERVKESDKARAIRYQAKDPLRALLKNVKQRAKAAGIEFTITKNDLHIPEICPVLGIPLIRNNKKGHWPNSPSIDRFDNTKGYIPGNVYIISWRANSLKRDATLVEMEMVVRYMKEGVPFVAF